MQRNKVLKKVSLHEKKVKKRIKIAKNVFFYLSFTYQMFFSRESFRLKYFKSINNNLYVLIKLKKSINIEIVKIFKKIVKSEKFKSKILSSKLLQNQTN